MNDESEIKIEGPHAEIELHPEVTDAGVVAHHPAQDLQNVEPELRDTHLLEPAGDAIPLPPSSPPSQKIIKQPGAKVKTNPTDARSWEALFSQKQFEQAERSNA